MKEKETLRVAYVDFWPEWSQYEDFVTPILSEKYDVIVDNERPDVVFHSIFNRMQSVGRYKNKKRVLILAENWRPAQFGAHYSVSFDPRTETNFRLPLWQMYWLLWPELPEKLANRPKHEEFERFAAFVVSNPSNMFRGNAFDQLNAFQRVHSYGKVRRNTFALDKFGRGKRWQQAKWEYFAKHPHKYMFAMENTSHPYYCTEKIMDAFLAGSVPIYWGDPKVGEDWNERAFVNATKDSRWLEKVKKGDARQMLDEPAFTDSQLERHLATVEEFKEWLTKIAKEG